MNNAPTIAKQQQLGKRAQEREKKFGNICFFFCFLHFILSARRRRQVDINKNQQGITKGKENRRRDAHTHPNATAKGKANFGIVAGGGCCCCCWWCCLRQFIVKSHLFDDIASFCVSCRLRYAVRVGPSPSVRIRQSKSYLFWSSEKTRKRRKKCNMLCMRVGKEIPFGSVRRSNGRFELLFSICPADIHSSTRIQKGPQGRRNLCSEKAI